MTQGVNLFEFVKSNVKISDYVRSLPNTRGLHSTGAGRWRCNNVISNGSNTAAMMLDDETGYFKVFSHGNESGDVISLYSIMNGGSLSPRDSAIGLASEMGVSIDPSLLKFNGGVSKSELSESMDNLSKMAHDYLVNSDEQDAVTAREYLKSRGMPDDMMESWRIGLFPSFMGDCMDMVDECGGIETFQKTGMVSDSDNPILVMAGRICFPIFSSYGKCISFSSRSVPGVDCYKPDSKYINTSSTSLYQKREVLYGMHLFKRNVTKTLIICEGNMDVLALNYETPDDVCAVATCGTALTDEHVSWIRKNNFSKVILNFDSDEAGQSATSKALWMVNIIDNIYVNNKGEGKDPWDSFEAGEKFEIDDTLSPILTYLAIYASKKSKQEMINWFTEAYKTLSFDSDREYLMAEIERISKVSRRFLLSNIDSDSSKSNNRHRVNSGSKDSSLNLSQGVDIVIAAMLSMPLEQRKVLFFPFFSKRTVNKAIVISNIRTKEDIAAMRIAMGMSKNADGEMVAKVSALTPNSEEDCNAAISFCSTYLSNRIKTEISNMGINSGYSPFIPALSNISGGISESIIDPKESLFMVMNCVDSIK